MEWGIGRNKKVIRISQNEFCNAIESTGEKFHMNDVLLQQHVIKLTLKCLPIQIVNLFCKSTS